VGQIFNGKEIYAIGGGKGGVGKSFISANLGVLLAKNKGRVLLVDADLGGANLHTCLGIPAPAVTLSDFIANPSMQIQDAIVTTPYENLQLLSGGQDVLASANPKYTQKAKILRAIQSIQADYVILDLGAGTNYNTLDFFLIADKGVLVVIPEPTSVENAYRFIKSALYRRLSLLAGDSQTKAVIEKATKNKNDLGIRNPAELVSYVMESSPETGVLLREALNQFRPRIILNQVRSLADIRIGFAMQSACLKYFGIHMDFIGYLEVDDHVWKSIRARQPVVINNGGKSFRGLESISHNLMNDFQMKPE